MSTKLPRGLVGVIHLPAMPGDPAHVASGGFEAVYAHAMRDADALDAGGIRAVVVENFGSRPFVKGTASDPLPPHQIAAMTVVARPLSERFEAIGINCLRNDVVAALGIPPQRSRLRSFASTCTSART